MWGGAKDQTQVLNVSMEITSPSLPHAPHHHIFLIVVFVQSLY